MSENGSPMLNRKQPPPGRGPVNAPFGNVKVGTDNYDVAIPMRKSGDMFKTTLCVMGWLNATRIGPTREK